MHELLLILGAPCGGIADVVETLDLLGAPGAGAPVQRDAAVFAELNDRLLAALGRAWDDVDPLPSCWHESSRLLGLSREAAEVIRSGSRDAAGRIVADHRLCHLVPFWAGVLDRLGMTARCLIVQARAGAVAATLAEESGCSAERASRLWAQHMLAADAGTRRLPRAIVGHDAVLIDPGAALRQAWSCLGLPATDLAGEAAPGGRPAPPARLDDLPPSLREIVVELDRLLARAAGTDGSAAAGELDELRERLLAGDVAALRGTLVEQGRHIQKLDDLLQERTRWMQVLARDQKVLQDVSTRLVEDVKLLKRKVKLLQRGGPVRRYAALGVKAMLHPRLAAQELRRRLTARSAPPAPPPSPTPLSAVGTVSANGEVITPVARELTREDVAAIALPAPDEPVVSIVIPIFDQVAVTARCLQSIAEHGADAPFEVILVDDCSTDERAAWLDDVKGLHVLRNDENLGFVRTCNRGAEAARGDYLLLLNNDTVVTDGWIDALLRTFETFPDAGAAGGKLVLADGTVQEAGGIVWRDGSAWNYGRRKHPDTPELSYARRADYVSGACLMIPRELWTELGGFDERYVPAYYEDTDLAFRVREAGRQVYYQPTCLVYHDEGTTSGTCTSTGVKRHQAENHHRFYSRWKQELATHRENGDAPEREKERHVERRLLFVDHRMLTPDQDSGSIRTFNMLRILQELGFKVTFVPDNLARQSPYTERLQEAGIEVIEHPFYSSLEAFLERRGGELEMVFLSRLQVASKHVKLVRRMCPQARIVYDTVDLHFLREQREAETTGQISRAEAETTKLRELQTMRLSDSTIVVSPYEQELLAELVPDVDVHVVSNIMDVDPTTTPFEQREGILFIGGFEHRPNVDAVLWFVKKIFPLVRERLPDVKFHIIGSKAPLEILELDSEATPVHGYVPDVRPFFERCKLSVAPLRYGAGVKGKVNQSLALGVPCVATACAVEGMGLVDDTSILVADGDAEFAQAVVRVYRDEHLWHTLASAGSEHIDRGFSFSAARPALLATCGMRHVSPSEGPQRSSVGSRF